MDRSLRLGGQEDDIPGMYPLSVAIIMLREHKRKLDSFHHRCIKTILGISNRQQWLQYIIVGEFRRRWEDLETATETVTKCRLEWLGRLAHMPGDRIPKSVLFGWLTQPHPRCVSRKRWKNYNIKLHVT